MLIHNADITGSLTINGVPYTTGSFSGSFIAGTNIMSANTVSLTGSFTGSFFGDGSQLSGVTSYTDADTLSFIQGYSGSYSGSFFGDGSNLSGVTSYTDADTLAFINSLDVVSGSIQTVSTVSDTFTSVTSYTVTHNFGTKEVIVSVYENDTLIFPSSITTPTTNTVTITFPEPVTGRVVVVKAGHIVSGSINYNSVLNKPTLVSGSSQISFTGITNKPTLVSGSSQITYSGIAGKPSGIVSGSAQVAQFGYATTGSNQFKANQTITGSLTVTGAIVAQTLNVQQVTSSIVYSSGSNIFGNSLANTQQFTGSLQVSGSSHYLLGNVLIGTTTNSNSRFQVIGPNSNLLPLVDLVASGTGLFQRGVRLLNSGMDSGDHIMYAVGQADNARNMGQVYFQYSGSASTSNRLSFGLHSVDDVLNILGTGNVGIGTVSPSAKLEVEAASNPEISIASTVGATSNLLSFKATSHSQPIQTQLKTIDNGNFTSDLAFLFKASGTGGALSEKMRITSDGKLQVIGTTGLPSTSGTTQNGTLRLQLVGYGTVLDFGAEGPSTGKQWIQATNSTDLSIKYPLLLNPNGGNVSIGTTSPGDNFILDITSTKASGASGMRLTTQSTSAGPIFVFNYTGSALTNWGIGAHQSTSGALEFISSNSAGGDPSTAGTSRMQINSNGNVGIGTTSLLGSAIERTVHLSDGGAGFTTLYVTNGANTLRGIFAVANTASTISIGTQSNHDLRLVTNDTEKARITTSGTLYVGTNTNPLSNATPLLGILAGTATDAINIKHTQNGNNTVNIWQIGTSSFAALAFYKGDSQGATVGSINCTTSGTTFTTTSDYRLKENIVPIENGIDRLMQLKPSKFNWIATGDEAEGFIAHELQEIFPDAVSGEKDAIYSSTSNIKPQSVDYGRITPLLVKAIQEQQTLIESLKSENDTLKSRIDILEQA